MSKKKEKQEKKETALIPDIITHSPPPDPIPRDLSFEKPPGIVLKENGILFSDKRDLEEALCLTIDNSKIRLQLANQAKVTISSCYSFNSVADSYIGLYEELCCV